MSKFDDKLTTLSKISVAMFEGSYAHLSGLQWTMLCEAFKRLPVDDQAHMMDLVDGLVDKFAVQLAEAHNKNR